MPHLCDSLFICVGIDYIPSHGAFSTDKNAIFEIDKNHRP